MNKKLTTSAVATLLLATNLYSNDHIELSEITVTSATKTKQAIKDITSNVDVITSAELEERHFVSVTEALNSLAGISFVSNGSLGNTSNIYVRGMDTNRVLVLIDGIRYQDPSNTSGAAFSHLMISDIEKIEVVKGPQSGVWGADASAGVINIITKDAQEGFHSSVNTEIGSYQTKKFGATVSNKTDKYDFKLTANRLLSDGYSSQATKGTDPKDFERDGYRNTTVNFKAGYNVTENDRVSVVYNHINSLVEYDSFNTPNSQQRSDNKSDLYSVSYNKKIKNHDIKFKYDLSKFKKKELDATFGVKTYNGQTKVIDLLDAISYRENDTFVIGVSHENYDVDYVQTTNSTNQKDNTSKSVYLTNTNTFNKLIFSQSLRRDSYSNFGSKYTGKVGAKYNLNQDLSFGANYGTAYNAPNIIHMLNPWGTSNLDLKPEKTKGYDVTATYKDFSLTYFNNKVDDLISWSGGGYQNIAGTSTLQGYEAKYRQLLTDDLLMNLNYTHLSAKDSKDQDLARRAKRQLGFALDYYGFEKLHMNINGSYVGTRYNSANKGGAQTGRYTLWNTVVNYDINDTFKTYIKLNNVFDKNYQTIDGYGTEGRAVYVGLKATF